MQKGDALYSYDLLKYNQCLHIVYTNQSINFSPPKKSFLKNIVCFKGSFKKYFSIAVNS